MTLDEIEQLARNVAAGMLAGSDRSLYVHSSLDLARALLLVLPVVKSAIAVNETITELLAQHVADTCSAGCRLCMLGDEIEHMRAVMAGKEES